MSQTPFVKLMVDYLQVISERGAELDAGSWRLGLAVKAPHTPADETAKLAYFARRQPDSRLFRAAVSAPRYRGQGPDPAWQLRRDRGSSGARHVPVSGRPKY